MTRIIHLSDTHFGTEQPQVVRALEEAMALQAPDIVMLTGDITQRARASQFRAARHFVASMPAHAWCVIPGNHDIPLYHLLARMVAPYGNYRDAFGKREGVWCYGNLGIIGYDATSRWRHTRGKLTSKQIASRAAEARRQLPSDGVLIACAHQPLMTAWEEDREERLIDAEATAQQLAAEKIDIMLSGHVHVPYIASTQAVFPTLPRHFIMSGAGTAISHRTRPGAPNSFNIIHVVSPHAIAIGLMEYDRDASAFRSRHTYHYARGDSGWLPAVTADRE